MHELYIADSLLRNACASLPQNHTSDAIRQIKVDIGALDAVVPENLVFIFNALKKDYGASDAELIINPIDVICQCRDCRCEFTLNIPVFRCPQCNSPQVDLLQGRGLTLTEIVIREED